MLDIKCHLRDSKFNGSEVASDLREDFIFSALAGTPSPILLFLLRLQNVINS